MKILLVNQCFYPDVVSAGQHLTDVAVELVKRGHAVTVISSRRGYDDPSLEFPASEQWSGINIQRVSVLGLGKRSKFRRALDFASFYITCFVRMLLLPRHDLIVMLTSPPLIGFAGTLVAWVKRSRLAIWIMDLNPDEAFAAGVLRADSAIGKTLDWILRQSLNAAHQIIVLDRFMRERVIAKGIAAEKISIIPPWSHDEAIRFDLSGRNDFRRCHGLDDKFVVMYSGNHSPCHPLDTVMEAAKHLSDDDRVRFCFIGGGSEFKRVKEFALQNGLSNITCLPYQPLETVSASLSAADMHVVVMGNQYPGIKHPCKIYSIIALGAPFVFIGPGCSHVSDLVHDCGIERAACFLSHGAVSDLVYHIEASSKRPTRYDHRAVSARFAETVLVGRLLDSLESGQVREKRIAAAAAG